MFEKKLVANPSPFPDAAWLNDTEVAPDVRERARLVVTWFGAADCLDALGLAD